MLAIEKTGIAPIDELLNNLNSAATCARATWEMFSPATDVRETADGYWLDLDLPGFTEKEVEVTLEGNHLTIKGERKVPENTSYTQRERSFGVFERLFHLPDDVDRTKIEAKAHNGVLTLTLPKAEAAKPRTINVAVGA